MTTTATMPRGLAIRTAAQECEDDVRLATGRLSALRTAHVCGEACTATVTLGDGAVRTLKCPLSLLDVTDATDRRIVGRLYAEDALRAMRR